VNQGCIKLTYLGPEPTQGVSYGEVEGMWHWNIW